MRERVEDLGRIQVMISHLLDQDLFDMISHVRKKDFLDDFSNKSEDERDTFIHQLPYQIEDIQEKLYDILCIANGQDTLNESEHSSK